jgi:hypothetical protein
MQFRLTVLSLRVKLISHHLSSPALTAQFSLLLCVVMRYSAWTENLRRSAQYPSVINPLPLLVVSNYCTYVAFPIVKLMLQIAVPLTVMELYSVLNISPDFFITFISPFRNVLMSLNSAVNVLVYIHSSSNFRPYLLNLLTCGKKGGISTTGVTVIFTQMKPQASNNWKNSKNFRFARLFSNEQRH